LPTPAFAVGCATPLLLPAAYRAPAWVHTYRTHRAAAPWIPSISHTRGSLPVWFPIQCHNVYRTHTPHSPVVPLPVWLVTYYYYTTRTVAHGSRLVPYTVLPVFCRLHYTCHFRTHTSHIHTCAFSAQPPAVYTTHGYAALPPHNCALFFFTVTRFIFRLPVLVSTTLSPRSVWLFAARRFPHTVTVACRFTVYRTVPHTGYTHAHTAVAFLRAGYTTADHVPFTRYHARLLHTACHTRTLPDPHTPHATACRTLCRQPGSASSYTQFFMTLVAYGLPVPYTFGYVCGLRTRGYGCGLPLLVTLLVGVPPPAALPHRLVYGYPHTCSPTATACQHYALPFDLPCGCHYGHAPHLPGLVHRLRTYAYHAVVLICGSAPAVACCHLLYLMLRFYGLPAVRWFVTVVTGLPVRSTPTYWFWVLRSPVVLRTTGWVVLHALAFYGLVYRWFTAGLLPHTISAV